MVSMYDFQEHQILNIKCDIEQQVKISMTISKIPEGQMLNVSKDLSQQLMFFM